jgi:hypothetical protein
LAAALCEALVFGVARVGARPFETPLPELAAAALSAGESVAEDPFADPSALDLPEGLDLPAAVAEPDLPLEAPESAADFGLFELSGFVEEECFGAGAECLAALVA